MMVHDMPDTASITIVKDFMYRGAFEEYSNKYHFEGTVPGTLTEWKALADAIIAAERPTTSNNRFVRAYGYVAGSENSVAQIDYKLAPNTVLTGTLALGSGVSTPGDVAGTIRWYTGQSNSRGKKIYCRKYMHGVLSSASSGDTMYAAQQTALATFAAKLIDGTLPGGFKYCGPQGADLSAPEVSPWLTTRTLKRRGKRPPTP